jgi:hypothetical protein
MQAYSGVISVTALAVSVISGLYLNSQIQALKVIVDSHSVQLKELQANADDLGRVAKQSLEISSASSNKIDIIKEDLEELTVTTAGEEYIPPSQMTRSYSSYRRVGSNKTPRSPINSRTRVQSRNSSPSELGAMVSEITSSNTLGINH